MNAKTYPVTIDDQQPFGQMVAAGAYDHVNGEITEANYRGATRLRSRLSQAQRQFPIVALDEYRRRPSLWGSARVRLLDLRFDEKIWSGKIHS